MKVYVNGPLVIRMKKIFTLWKIIIKGFFILQPHLLYAYQPKGKKDDVTDKDEVPEFIEKKFNQLKLV